MSAPPIDAPQLNELAQRPAVGNLKDSKVIWRSNKDPEATISTVADYALEGDPIQIVPELSV